MAVIDLGKKIPFNGLTLSLCRGTGFAMLTKLNLQLIFLAATQCFSWSLHATESSYPINRDFSKYILKSVQLLAEKRASKGYGNAVFTQDLQFGDSGILKATNAPLTMCVAAQLEVIVEALNFYAAETNDYSPFHFIPKISWARLRPLDLRGMIWIVDRTKSTGAGSAFERYGMGHSLTFREMFPGAFLNFNRTNKTGHAVVFLGYLDKDGNDVPQYGRNVAGFKYFSAQGRNRPDGGLGYRWAFFTDVECPVLAAGHKRDCDLIRSENNGYLTGGYILPPSKWDAQKANAAILSNNDATDPSLTTEGSMDTNFFSGVTTDD